MPPLNPYHQLLDHCNQIFLHNNLDNIDMVIETVKNLPSSVNNPQVISRYKTFLKQYWDRIEIYLKQRFIHNQIPLEADLAQIKFILSYLEQDAKTHNY